MEVFFVKILNRSLVIFGFVALAASIIAVVTAAIMLSPPMVGVAPSKTITVSYTPLNEVSGTISSTSTPTSDAAPSASAEATKACTARNVLVEKLTNKQLRIDIAKCAPGEDADAEARFNNRAANYLEQKAFYYTAIANDPQSSTKYPNAEREQFNEYLEAIDKEFDDKFSANVSREDARLEAEGAKAIARSVTGYTALQIAGTGFLAFLVIAFLLVATRIEKHLSGIEKKIPTT